MRSNWNDRTGARQEKQDIPTGYPPDTLRMPSGQPGHILAISWLVSRLPLASTRLCSPCSPAIPWLFCGSPVPLAVAGAGRNSRHSWQDSLCLRKNLPGDKSFHPRALPCRYGVIQSEGARLTPYSFTVTVQV